MPPVSETTDPVATWRSVPAPPHASARQEDAAAIGALVSTLFTSFASAEAANGALDRLPAIFAPEARVVVLSAGALTTLTVADFLRPRRALLLGGGLTDFREWEIDGDTLFGRDVACRRCRYAKTGVRDGHRFEGSGTKVISFVRRDGEWRILELLWQDDA